MTSEKKKNACCNVAFSHILSHRNQFSIAIIIGLINVTNRCNLVAVTAASQVTANVSQVNLQLLMYYRLKYFKRRNFRGLVRMTFGLAHNC